MPPLILLVVVGLSPKHLVEESHAAQTATLRHMQHQGGGTPILGIVPGVTMAAQATILTGKLPQEHGIVGNGWHFRDTDEIRFWQQSRNLIHGPLIYETARRLAREQGREFIAANIFGWFNQASQVEYSITPKPWYGADGSKAFGVHGKPTAFVAQIQSQLGPFPFHTFWGPKAGAPATTWIAQATAIAVRDKRPDFTIAYLPHLDYDLQRFGPTGAHIGPALQVIDDAVATVQAAAHAIGGRVVVVSEYGIVPVTRSVALNRVLRKAGFLLVRDGPFGEIIDVPDTPAVAVADHQIAHISVRNGVRIEEIAELLADTPGVKALYVGAHRHEIGLDHPRAGDIVALADSDAWFSYEYWVDPRRKPDFAPTVDIHRKPGYDPQELFFAPALKWPTLKIIRRLLRKKLGFRTLFDVIAVDRPDLIAGSHGLMAKSNGDGPMVMTDDPTLAATLPASMTGIHDWLLTALTEPTI